MEYPAPAPGAAWADDETGDTDETYDADQDMPLDTVPDEMEPEEIEEYPAPDVTPVPPLDALPPADDIAAGRGAPVMDWTYAQPVPARGPVLRRGARRCCARVTLEGMASLLREPQEVFGEQAFTGNQMTWEVLEYGFELGGRGVIEYMPNAKDRLELSGVYYGEWSDAGRTSGNFAFSPPIPGLVTTNSATLTAESTAYGGEFNWFHQIGCGSRLTTELGLGARYLQFDEEATANAFGTAFIPGFPSAPFVHSEVENAFIGVQFLGRANYEMSNCLEAIVGLDVMFGNLNSDVAVNDDSIFAGGPHASANAEDRLVFGLEFELGLRYRIASRVGLGAGYRFLFLDDVVRAHDAMAFDKSFSGAVQASQTVDQLILHTFFVGLSLEF